MCRSESQQVLNDKSRWRRTYALGSSCRLLPTSTTTGPHRFKILTAFLAWRQFAIRKSRWESIRLVAPMCTSGSQIYEVPVGFNYFVDGLLYGYFGSAGEGSAGALFRRREAACRPPIRMASSLRC